MRIDMQRNQSLYEVKSYDYLMMEFLFTSFDWAWSAFVDLECVALAIDRATDWSHGSKSGNDDHRTRRNRPKFYRKWSNLSWTKIAPFSMQLHSIAYPSSVVCLEPHSWLARKISPAQRLCTYWTGMQPFRAVRECYSTRFAKPKCIRSNFDLMDNKY